jgi:hypothetical protein
VANVLGKGREALPLLFYAAKRIIMTNMDRDAAVTILHSLYIDNHPDRFGFGGPVEDLISWALRMGLLNESEASDLLKAHKA